MEKRTKGILGTLTICLLGTLSVALFKIVYGGISDNLAFIADGIHSLFDSASTGVGLVTILMASKPPDDDHPYGHRKFEMLGAVFLAVLLVFAAYEVGALAYQRLRQPNIFPTFSFSGILILLGSMAISLSISSFEKKRAVALKSNFLKSDAIHNQSDFWTACAVLVSLVSGKFRIPYVDAITAIVIMIYLIHISLKLINMNIHPLVDRSVVDPKQVQEIANSVEGVLHCHNVRSRGESDHYFLDLNLHLPGHISLEKAHEITHSVEAKLKAAFPGLQDVVIHTEPDGHPPCNAD
jgi:cation diffusion facilitator family transporter